MNEHYPFINPPLPYSFNALEPFIDAKTMELHHNRHLQTYIDQLNETLKPYPQYHTLSLEQLLYYIDSLPKNLKTPILHNAGGSYNHILYFFMLGNPSTDIPPAVSSFFTSQYDSFDTFQKEFKDAALSVFGSGYAWLTLDAFGKAKIITTANQDTPISLNLYPILPIDVWEHAYYLKHYNKRSDYIDDWFKVVDWQAVYQRIRQSSYKSTK